MECDAPLVAQTDRHRALSLCPRWRSGEWDLIEEARRSYTETFGALRAQERLALRYDDCDISDWRVVTEMPRSPTGPPLRHITLDALRRGTLRLTREKETQRGGPHHDWFAFVPLLVARQAKASQRIEVGRAAQAQFVVQRVEPGDAIGEARNTLPERHAGITQLLYVLEGQCEVLLSADALGLYVADRVALYAHGALVVPPGQFHLVRNTGAAPLLLFSVYSPPEDDAQ